MTRSIFSGACGFGFQMKWDARSASIGINPECCVNLSKEQLREYEDVFRENIKEMKVGASHRSYRKKEQPHPYHHYHLRIHHSSSSSKSLFIPFKGRVDFWFFW